MARPGRIQLASVHHPVAKFPESPLQLHSPPGWSQSCLMDILSFGYVQDLLDRHFRAPECGVDECVII